MQFFSQVLSDINNRNYAFLDATLADGTPVFPAFRLTEEADASVVVIYGDNASGKSIIGKLVEQTARSADIEVRNLCVGNRTRGGMEASLIFGNEGEQSTGATSIAAIKLALNSTCNGDKKAIVILDEPDIGLSRRFAKALGRYLASSANEMADMKGMVVITHNIDMLQSFVDGLQVPFTSLGVGTSSRLYEWMYDDQDGSVDELLGLANLGHQRWGAIDKALKNARSEGE